MKNILLFLSAFLLISCNSNNQPVSNQVDSNAIEQHKDTVAKDTSFERVNRLFNNPFRDINNFNVQFGDRFIDSLHSLYANQKQTKATFTKDICIGDNCESYTTITNKQEHTVLYLFKGDGGEYGFSNDQFYLNKDSLAYARNFIVNVNTWSTDSTDTEWKIEEIVYNFQTGNPYKTTRAVFTRTLDQFDFTLSNVVPKSDTAFDLTKAYEEKLAELDKLLKMKDSEDRE